jgi:repressor LexA
MVSDRLPPSPRQQQILQLIAAFIDQHGLPPTRADLARLLGLNNRPGIDQHLRALERKGHIALQPGVARGIRLLAPATTAAAAAAKSTASLQRSMLLPLYGRVAAGVPTLALDNIENEIAIDATLFRPRADFMLRVHGESMRDAGIRDRDILAVHRTAQADNGQVVVARLGDEATVKYYRRRGALVRLEPANADFNPIEIDLRRHAFAIEGLVVGIIRAGVPRAALAAMPAV